MRLGFNQSNTPRETGEGNETLYTGHNPGPAKIAVLSCVFVLATLGNGIFLCTLWQKRKRNSRTRLYLCHLCTADLVVTFFQVLPQLLWEVTDTFMAPNAVCKTVKYLQIVGMFASTYLLVVMTLDRYQAICKPMTSITKSSLQRHLAVGLAWALSLIFSVPQIFIFSMQEVQPQVFECWATFIKPWGRKSYITWTTLVVFAIPAAVLIICQVKICRTIYLTEQKNRQEMISLTKASMMGARVGTLTMGVPSALLKTLKMTFVVVVVYILCWAPFFIVQLWSVWDPTGAPTNGSPFTIIMLLAGLNSCTNPWIYMAFSASVSLCLSERKASACLMIHIIYPSTSVVPWITI
ncbi:vasopressin V2 receptor-like [Heptranchias perlo]|uniref:vasopressin V2 receptor-like n=1 Tax=Heptranchias perlo TaxID=212740 RepID=UPI00355A876C